MGEARWLTAEEQAAWRSFMTGCRALFTALDGLRHEPGQGPAAIAELMASLPPPRR